MTLSIIALLIYFAKRCIATAPTEALLIIANLISSGPIFKPHQNFLMGLFYFAITWNSRHEDNC